MKKNKNDVICFKDVFSFPVWHAGPNLICHGGVWVPQCEHLRKCIQQYTKMRVPEKELKKMIRKYVTNKKNKDANNTKRT